MPLIIHRTQYGHARSSRECSPDRRVGAVSPRGRNVPQQREKPQGGGLEVGSGAAYNNIPDSKKASVSQLVRGHTGSVMALAVFEGTQEYATGGYDR